MEILAKTDADQNWIHEYLMDLWGSTDIYLPNGRYDASVLPALYTQDKDVLATYSLNDRAEVVTINIPFGYDQDHINQLISSLCEHAKEHGRSQLFATVTNDNLDLMGYLQRAGFRFNRIYNSAIEDARNKQNTIPEIGKHDIPMHDEIEFVLKL